MLVIEKIWDCGIPFFDADLHFAPRHSLEAYRSIEKTIKSLPEVSEHRPSQEALDIIVRRVSLLVARNDLRAKMMDELLVSLAAEKLIAYGFSVPRHPEQAPVQTPRALFESPVLDSKHHGLTGNGLEFVAVRVFDPDVVRCAVPPLPNGRS